jgi:hypothetical protein
VFKDECERRVKPTTRFASASVRLKSSMDSYMKNAEGLYFGFVPSETMEKLTGNNWRNKQAATVEVEQLLGKMGDGFSKVLQYMANFSRFIKEMLDESNYRIVLSLLGIVHEICRRPGISNHANMV